MDPTAQHCEIHNSFFYTPTRYFPDRWSYVATTTTTARSSESLATSEPLVFSRDQNLRTELQKHSPERLTAAYQATDPFWHLRPSVFMNRVGLQLANVDTVLNFTGTPGTCPLEEGCLTYCALGGASGVEVQYLQYRKPSARGYGFPS